MGFSRYTEADVKLFCTSKIDKCFDDKWKENAGVESTNYEIGSHFWLDLSDKSELKSDSERWLPIVEDSSLTFSGRSAIELALLDIKKEKRVSTAYLPSYCCESMVTPFIKNDFSVEFYDIDFQKSEFVYKIDENAKYDVALVMSYFGLCSENAHSIIEKLSKRGTIIIEDITHSLLSKRQNSEKSDYLVAGLRKWFAIPTGGWIGKKKGKLHLFPYKDSELYIRDKVEGMREKALYMVGEKIEKSRFLELQNSFESFLDIHDCMLKIDTTSQQEIRKLSISEIRCLRKSNADQLYRGIQSANIEGIQIPKLDLDNDTPLFLPVFFKRSQRESLRRYLIDHQIYCPVHWPEVKGADPGVRDNELSIICDQRYSTKDMAHIIDTIEAWKTNYINQGAIGECTGSM